GRSCLYGSRWRGGWRGAQERQRGGRRGWGQARWACVGPTQGPELPRLGKAARSSAVYFDVSYRNSSRPPDGRKLLIHIVTSAAKTLRTELPDLPVILIQRTRVRLANEV